ncbi:MAG TPA: S41 family peptidase [Chloroflexota bacterium]
MTTVWIRSHTARQLLFLLSATLAQLPIAGHTAPAYSSAEIREQVELVRQATGLLVTRSIQSPSSADLLQAAWRGLAENVDANGRASLSRAPAFTGASRVDESSFESAFAAYLTQLRVRPAFNPAHASIRAMARSAADGHTYFLDPAQRQRYEEASHLDQTYVGVGLGFVGPGLVVSRVVENSPAARAEIHPGDAIVEIDGRPVDGHTTREAAEWLHGPVGSHVTLSIRSPGEVGTHQIGLERQSVMWRALATDIIDDHIGYIQLSTFEDPGVADAFDTALSNLDQEGVRGLIIDLRGNPGGRLDVGARMLADLLPPNAPAFQQIDRSGIHALRARSATQHFVHAAVVVLIDGDSGSMSELFAAAVHEYKVATLIGQTTSGNVAGGQLFPLRDGSALDVTTSELRSAHGVVLNGRGVAPDIRVDGTRLTDPDGKDPAIRAALRSFRH